MIHHVQRKRIHNAAAINKGMKHWSKVLFIWRLHAADVCSSLPPPPLFLSFLTTFSETGHITTARYAVKDVLKSRCCGFTVHNAGLKARFALYVSNRGMWVCLCYWTWPRRCRFRVQRGGFFSSPRRCQPRYPREHRHQTHRGFFLSIYVTPDLSLKQGGSLFLSLKLSFSLQFTLFRSGGFRVQVHCQARPGHVEGRPAVGLKQKHWVDLLFLSVCVMQSCVIWLKVV